jgi:hypothetical protein
MSGLLRVAFVNTSNDTHVTVDIETQDAVECCELLTSTSAVEPEAPGPTYPPGRWNLLVPPGKIFGFVTERPVKIINQNPANLVVVYADGKDPWPQPPPKPPLAATPDFGIRYQHFLAASALPNSTPKPIVMTLTPAPASP